MKSVNYKHERENEKLNIVREETNGKQRETRKKNSIGSEMENDPFDSDLLSF